MKKADNATAAIAQNTQLDQKQLSILINGNNVKLYFPDVSEDSVITDVKRMMMSAMVSHG